ncbi:MAG: enoyl-CoA hydratase-related protein [Clostridiales bacterium]
MDYKFLICTIINENILRISLNRPEVLNSFNTEMRLELLEALQYASLNDNIRTVFLSSEGRAFSAGQDLKEILSLEKEKADPALIVRNTYNPIIKTIRQIEKPVLCMVNGIAAGAAANIAFSCDIALASTDASFVESFSQIGLIPDSGGTYFLPRLIGLQKSSALMMMAEKISADMAFQMGLIYMAVDPEDLEPFALEMAKKLSLMPTKALAYIKRALNLSFSNTLDEQLELEAKLQHLAGKTGDYKEGIKAFLEKRKPDFKGH